MFCCFVANSLVRVPLLSFTMPFGCGADVADHSDVVGEVEQRLSHLQAIAALVFLLGVNRKRSPRVLAGTT